MRHREKIRHEEEIKTCELETGLNKFNHAEHIAPDRTWTDHEPQSQNGLQSLNRPKPVGYQNAARNCDH
jgi:hypothetical protein